MRVENTNKEVVVETLRRKWDAMQNHLDERGRRIWAASEAEALGHGGVTIVYSDRMSAATGMSRSAITQGYGRNYSSAGCRTTGSGTDVQWWPEKNQ
jgi:hypothetical protein